MYKLADLVHTDAVAAVDVCTGEIGAVESDRRIIAIVYNQPLISILSTTVILRPR